MKTAAIPVDKPSIKPENADPATRWARLVVPLLCVIYLAECGWFIHTQSLTYDEPVHIAAGQDAWRNNRFQMWNDHPPLARLWCALPLLNERWQIHAYGFADGFRVDEIKPDPEALAWRARAMNVFLGLALALFLWDAARRMFSTGAGLLALALFVFSPALIGHFSVATTDGAATLLIFVTAISLWRWRIRQDWIATLRFGLVLGLLLLAKFSTPVMFVLAILWTLVLKSDAIAYKPWRWNWDRALTAAVLALLLVWAGYFFHVSRLTLRDHVLTATFPNRPTVVYENVKSSLNLSLPVPAGEYVEGLRSLVRHNRFGQVSFFLGRISRRGFKAYYPVAIVLKWPIVFLVLCAVAILLVSRSSLCLPEGWWVIASFPVVYLGFAIFSRFDIGDRHVLPIYPFLLLLACAVWEKVKERRAFAVVIMIAVLLQAADTLRYAPDYLSYFNIFVAPTRSYKILTDSNLDWGQGLLALRMFEQDHPTEKIWLAYFGSVEPRVYGIRSQPLGEHDKPTGTIVVSASHLSGQFLQEPAAYHWLLQYPRIAVLNHSLFVYNVDNIHN